MFRFVLTLFVSLSCLSASDVFATSPIQVQPSGRYEFWCAEVGGVYTVALTPTVGGYNVGVLTVLAPGFEERLRLDYTGLGNNPGTRYYNVSGRVNYQVAFGYYPVPSVSIFQRLSGGGFRRLADLGCSRTGN